MKEACNPQWMVNSGCLNSVIQAAHSLELDTSLLLDTLGVDISTLREVDSHHRADQLFALYAEVDRLANCPDIGIYSGRINFINRLNLLLYTLTVCKTFRDYLNVMPSAFRFMGDVGEVLVNREENYLRLEWHPLWQASSEQRYLSDEILTGSTLIVSSLCMNPLPVIKAHFSYPKPENTDVLEAVFGPNLYFDQAISCLYYPWECLDYPLTQLYQQWNQSFNLSIKHLFADNKEEDEFLTQVRKTLLKNLPAAELSIELVASSLNISKRTLQRRLAARDSLFSQLLQDLREELAEQYLSDERLSITDIAFLLGYTDHGSFSTAFKSWHGQSPRSYRQQLLTQSLNDQSDTYF